MMNKQSNNELSSEILSELKSLKHENNQLKDYLYKFINQVKLFMKNSTHRTKSVDGLITIKDLCAKLSITNATVHNWIKGGILSKQKIGGRTYLNLEDVNKIIENKGRK